MRQDSNLESLNYESKILSISRFFHVIQIVINSLKHVRLALYKVVLLKLARLVAILENGKYVS